MKKAVNKMSKVLSEKKDQQLIVPKMETNYTSKCYVCDQNISGLDEMVLVNAILPFSHLSIPQKIGKLVGQNCMVLVHDTDLLCAKCTNLFFELDRLETEAEKIIKIIVSHLTQKYDINGNSITPMPPLLQGLKRKLNIDDNREQAADSKREEIEKKLSDMFGSPVTITSVDNSTKYLKTSCKSTKSKNTQPYRCPICREGYDEQKRLRLHIVENHLSKYKCNICQLTFKDEQLLKKHFEQIDCESNINPLNTSNSNSNIETLKKFKCAICSRKFESKEYLNVHLRKHKSVSFKCGSCGEKFQKRDNLMKHLDLHVSSKSPEIAATNNTSTNENLENINSNKTTVAEKQIKFLDCKSCSLSYIDSEHYSLHLNTSHRKLKQNTSQAQETVKQEQVDNSNHIDLEQIFEKLHADTNEIKPIENTNQMETMQTETANGNTNVIDDLLTENFADQTKKIDCTKQNKVYLYKCPGCTSLYDNSNDLQLHILTANHVQYNTEIQILEVDHPHAESSTNNTQIDLLNFNTTPDTASNEIKLITFQDDVQNADVSFNDATNTSSKEIQELLESCVEHTPLTISPSVSNSKQRSKIQIIDEKTIDISQLVVSTAKDDLATSDFQLNELCNLTVKSEAHITNVAQQVSTSPSSSNDVYLLSAADFLSSDCVNGNDITTIPLIKTILKCGKCDFKCTQRDVIKLHMTKHNNTDTECKLCNRTFRTIKLLNRHNVQYHRKPICIYCNKYMRNTHALRIHEQRHLRAGDMCTCIDCGKQFKTKWGLNNHRPVHTGNYKLFCEFCNRGFMSNVMLDEHRAKHTKEKRCVCDICGKKFQFKSTYWIHRKWHDNPFPYKCNLCNRKFRHTSLLAVHRRKHTGERPYKCSHCHQSFLTSHTLKCHLMLHTGIYPYVCELCAHGLTTKHKLAVHMAKKHGDTKMLNRKTAIETDNYKMVIKSNVNDQLGQWPSTENDKNGEHESILIDNTFNNFYNSNDV